ncbi:hypothetical protein ABW19_dt0210576 [Dactylella cylindrospora]|nr:hypothetical protein ABW19_dt0210576 [Dactylella cylindrospora]
MASQVFFIPEILELILYNTPAINVITTYRRVCHTWKSLIETSPLLQSYATTGLQIPFQRKADEGPRPVPFREYDAFEAYSGKVPPSRITPMALEILTHFWKRLAPHALTYYKADRHELLRLLKKFYPLIYPVAKKVRLLDPRYGYSSFRSNTRTNWARTIPSPHHTEQFSEVFQSVGGKGEDRGEDKGTLEGAVVDALWCLADVVFCHTPWEVEFAHGDGYPVWEQLRQDGATGGEFDWGELGDVIYTIKYQEDGEWFPSQETIRFGSYEPFDVELLEDGGFKLTG